MLCTKRGVADGHIPRNMILSIARIDGVAYSSEREYPFAQYAELKALVLRHPANSARAFGAASLLLSLTIPLLAAFNVGEPRFYVAAGRPSALLPCRIPLCCRYLLVVATPYSSLPSSSIVSSRASALCSLSTPSTSFGSASSLLCPSPAPCITSSPLLSYPLGLETSMPLATVALLGGRNGLETPQHVKTHGEGLKPRLAHDHSGHNARARRQC